MSGFAPPPKGSATVWATHRFVGWHCWPDAPPKRAYLASLHRHVFHVRAELSVTHDDREVEFHDLLDAVAAECEALGTHEDWRRVLGAMSCEMIASQIVLGLILRFPGRRYAVDVAEDGECGSTVVFPDGRE